jgi:predicted kinase
MRTIYLTRGLPASGKSTWAKSLIDKHRGGYKRVNKDDLRSMLDNSQWSDKNEKFILKLRDHIIKETIRSGRHVIVDDTNLHEKHESRMNELISELKKEGISCKLEVKDFTDVDIKLCIERDLKRPNSVGEKVILKMYNQYIKKEEPVSKRAKDPNLPNCIIVDIDGTLALKGDRSPYDLSRIDEDTLNVDIAEIVKIYNFLNTSETDAIFIFSGRSDSCKEVTEKWLLDNKVSYTKLVMRKSDDNRKDYIVKREMFEEHIEGKYNVLFLLDDRNRVVEMWRKELGLTCLQVQEGDF